MANRRMFAKTITRTGRFLRMPASSRLLYYDLGMDADDDGVVEAYAVMKATGASEDDLRVLVSKGYVTILDEDLLAYINDWNVNNFIRSDRYTPSLHQKKLIELEIPVRFAIEGSEEEDGIPDGIPGDIPAVYPGKDRLGKDNLDKDININISDSEKETKPKKHKYGAYKHVMLTDSEHEKLVSEYGNTLIEEAIRILDEGIELKGYKYKSHNLALQKWPLDEARKTMGGKRNEGNTGNGERPHREYHSDDDLDFSWH